MRYTLIALGHPSRSHPWACRHVVHIPYIKFNKYMLGWSDWHPSCMYYCMKLGEKKNRDKRSKEEEEILIVGFSFKKRHD